MSFDIGDIPGSLIGLIAIITEIVLGGAILDILQAFATEWLAWLLYILLLAGTTIATVGDLIGWANVG